MFRAGNQKCDVPLYVLGGGVGEGELVGCGVGACVGSGVRVGRGVAVGSGWSVGLSGTGVAIGLAGRSVACGWSNAPKSSRAEEVPVDLLPLLTTVAVG